MTKCPWWVWASLLATALVSLASLQARYRVEASNRAVGLLMEAGVIAEAAAIEGRPFDEALAFLADRGLVGVAITETTVGDAVATGRIALFPTERGATVQGPPETLRRVARAVARRGGLGGSSMSASTSALGLTFTGDLDALRATSIGIDSAVAASARSLGLVVVARHANAVGAGPAYIRDLLDESHEHGATAYLGSGDQVLGYRTSVEDTVFALRDLGMHYLTPEFVKLSGDTSLTTQLIDGTLRLHAMQQVEADRTSPTAITERYARAFRERNMRWLLIRPSSIGGNQPLRTMALSLLDVGRGVRAVGGEVREPRPFEAPVWNPWFAPVLTFAALPALAWGVVALFGPGWWRRIGFVVVTGVGLASLFEPTRELAALGLAIAFPILGVLWLRIQDRLAIPLRYAVVTVFSLVGGLAVAGSLVGLPYMLQVDQFPGVKAATAVPLLVVATVLALGHVRPAELWERSVSWGALLVGVVALAAVAVMLVRTGNDSPGAVSDLELRFRALLDRLLTVRPRTKEFLIGHPALIVGLGLRGLAPTRPVLGPVSSALIVLGVLGQTSVVNTLCHLHSPLDLSLMRVAIGWAVGGILGLVAWAVVHRWTAPRLEGP